jgi:hypothetical protein
VSVRERHRSVLREQWRFLLVFGLSMLAVSIAASFFATGPLQRGFILGSGLAVAAGAVAALVVLVSGTASLMMGELAEQWTAQELRPLTNSGWKLVNHFGLGYGDQDHVLVGPGGVVLIETKWGATPWDLDDRDHFFQLALDQTARNAKQLERWHGVAQHGRPHVEPVLVLWGRARRKLADQPVRPHRSGVIVMSGDQLQDWMLRRGRDRLDGEQVAGIWAQVERQVEKRDVHERRTRPMPRSLAELLQTVVGCVVAAVAGFLVLAQALEPIGMTVTAALVGPVLATVAELVRRRSRWRWQARAFQAGLVSTYLVGAFAVARFYVTS